MKKESWETRLGRKIKTRKAHVAVIGLGYVGLPLAHAFAEKGFRVTGLDLDTRKISAINQGKSYIEDLASSELRQVVRRKKLRATSNFDVLDSVDVVIVCVPTPLNRVRDPDMSFIVSANQEIAKRLHPGELVILESTTYPGTTEEVILPALSGRGLKVGKDFFLCFSPERIDPANPQFKTQNIPKVVGGITPACGRLGSQLYSNITMQVVTVSSTRTAEMAKLLENTFRIVNIGLINELARAARNLKVDIWEAIDAARTKPFGYMPFYPGPGIGGHCIGIDPLYLSWKAKVQGTDLHFIELARRVNAEMPHHVVSEAVYTLNQKFHKAISRSKVMVLGITYKKDVSDIRESPALDILLKLKELGAKVSYHDPYVPRLEHESLVLKSEPLTVKNLKSKDLVILTTNHSCFNSKFLTQHSRLIYDTRNAFKGLKVTNVVRL